MIRKDNLDENIKTCQNYNTNVFLYKVIKRQ